MAQVTQVKGWDRLRLAPGWALEGAALSARMVAILETD
jgi:hypothetical protein